MVFLILSPDQRRFFLYKNVFSILILEQIKVKSGGEAPAGLELPRWRSIKNENKGVSAVVRYQFETNQSIHKCVIYFLRKCISMLGMQLFAESNGNLLNERKTVLLIIINEFVKQANVFFQFVQPIYNYDT